MALLSVLLCFSVAHYLNLFQLNRNSGFIIEIARVILQDLS